MAPSKTLFRRLQALRAQCRAFSGSAQARRPVSNSSTPLSDMMRVLGDGYSRAAAKSKDSPKGGVSYLQGQLAAHKTISRTELETGFRTADFDASHTRRYVPGDIIAPHDLSFAETRKWRFDPRKRPQHDVFDVLGMNPSKEYKNFGLLGEFVSDMGRIKGRKETGLRARNQRRVARAVRRAVGLGLVPSVSRHPEVLERAIVRRSKNVFNRR